MAAAFRYRALINGGRNAEIFTSDVEYAVGDIVQLPGASSWRVDRVEQDGVEHADRSSMTLRILYCEPVTS